MIITTILGIASSLVSEIITWLNQKLTGTFLEGNGAFLVALLIAFVGATIKYFYVDANPLPASYNFATLKDMFPAFAQVWTISQIYFIIIAKNLNIDTKKVYN